MYANIYTIWAAENLNSWSTVLVNPTKSARTRAQGSYLFSAYANERWKISDLDHNSKSTTSELRKPTLIMSQNVTGIWEDVQYLFFPPTYDWVLGQ